VPRYIYQCSACQEFSEVNRSVTDTRVDCELCDTKQSLIKFLGKPINSINPLKNKKNRRTGEVVCATIEEVKKEIKKEKKNLRSRSE